MTGKIQRSIAAVVAVGALALVSACGSGSTSAGSSNSPTSTGSSNSPSSGGGSVTEDSLFNSTETIPTLPKVTPPPRGSKVWIITCGLSASGCANAAETDETVMKSVLGWDVTLFDGKLTPATYIAGIDQAIVAGAKAIVLVAIDCTSVQPALEKAKAAGIPVIGSGSYDCTGSNSGLLQLGDIGGAPQSQWEYAGKKLADYVAYSTNGSGKVILTTEPDFRIVAADAAAFKTELAAVCPKCQIVSEDPALAAELGNGAAATKLGTALVQNPDASIIVAPSDAQVSYIQQAVRTAGSSIPIVTFGGTSTDVQYIKSGQLTASLALDDVYQGWVVADSVSRLLAGQKTATSLPFGAVFIDKTHNLPSSNTFATPLDYQTAFKTAWGLQ